jgi:hypothetical protein
MELAKKSLELKRKVIQRHMDAGLFPYTKRYLGTLRNHFSTIGVNGINEMIRNFTDDAEDITTDWGHDFAARLLDHVRDRMVQFQEETGHMYNLEATPAEGTTYRFAREDKKRFPPSCRPAPRMRPTTPTHPSYRWATPTTLPGAGDAGELQSKYTGGTVLHLYMSEQVSSTDACKRLVRRALTNFRLPYITVTPIFSICPTHGYLAGEHEFCPKCDQELIAKKRLQLGIEGQAQGIEAAMEGALSLGRKRQDQHHNDRSTNDEQRNDRTQRRRAHPLRGLDARHGLSPTGLGIQRWQARRARRSRLLLRATDQHATHRHRTIVQAPMRKPPRGRLTRWHRRCDCLQDRPAGLPHKAAAGLGS